LILGGKTVYFFTRHPAGEQTWYILCRTLLLDRFSFLGG